MSPFFLALTLLVARILTDDENLAMASDNLALVAHLLDRRTYLHITFLSVCGSFYTYTPSRWRLFSKLEAAAKDPGLREGAPLRATGRCLGPLGPLASLTYLKR